MNKKIFEWAIVGAGPAGIAALGKLLDHGIAPEKILWVDPEFAVGDLGKHWSNVSSNTSVRLFLQFLQNASSFAYEKAPKAFLLNQLPQEKTCLLQHIAEPLQWVTQQLCQNVHAKQTMIHEMKLSKRVWLLQSDSETFAAKQVILATGAVAESLNHPEIETIAFETAIDCKLLAQAVKQEDSIAVFGSSHSAIIIIKNLVDLGVKKIVNFYRSPCRYAVNMGDWILFDNAGLKGETAEWAREHIDGVRPDNLSRYINNAANLASFLPECNKAVYAVGFKRRNSIHVHEYEPIQYNPHLGIIGPGLFGLGIAYPELKADPFGNEEYQVGLWKFMVYLNKILPVWLKYSP
ncbi:FAD-dependent oxidoreductase [Legionella sp. 27cVA30]|uniref:FAD-dependent oxidoreductase n=1 Tax=Legionella sp. 27cVA30 TaxID=2905657 RepID=UPI00209FB429|nr:FAD-dependent oxidoreductase [Legionella sp. 27cVA30]MCP0913076.1 FAD-dependent oxidoreductase [Legionella sp. 27cVA30]